MLFYSSISFIRYFVTWARFEFHLLLRGPGFHRGALVLLLLQFLVVVVVHDEEEQTTTYQDDTAHIEQVLVVAEGVHQGSWKTQQVTIKSR